MKIDNLYTRALVAEMQYLGAQTIQKEDGNYEYEGARIERIFQPTQFEVVFNLRTLKGNEKLLLSIHPETFRFHMTKGTIENPLNPKQFCLVLRKHLESGKIVKVEQLNHDRHVVFTIESYNVVGNRVKHFLHLEMMGRHSNLILVDEQDIIVDSLKRVDISKSEVREVLPKLPYVILDKNNFDGKFPYYLQPEINEWLEVKKVEPIVLPLYALDPQGYYYRGYEDNKVFLSFFDMEAIFDLEKFECLQFPTLSEALDLYFHEQTTSQQLQEKVSSLLQFVSRHHKKNKTKLKKLEKELDRAENYEIYQMQGNLLLSHQHSLEDYITEAEVANFYQVDQPMMTIKLAPRLTILENAQKYFKRYNKSKTAIDKLGEQIELTQVELTYFETIMQSLEQANLEVAEEIRSELIEGGYLRRKKQAPRKKSKPQFTEFTYGDAKYLVGKNNLQNDYVTTKMKRRDFMWFHVKDFPGSHVLLTKKDATNEEIEVGALLAAFYSKMRNSENVNVDYTLVQNVSKPSGAKPGYVIYKSQKTIPVTPSVSKMLELFPNSSL